MKVIKFKILQHILSFFTIKLVKNSTILLPFLYLSSGCTLSQINHEIMEYTDSQRLVPKVARRQVHEDTPTRQKTYKQMHKEYLFNQKFRPVVDDYFYEGYGRPYDPSLAPPNKYGDDSYGAGWEDGCDTYSAAVGAGSYRLIKFKIDGWRMTRDEWYLRGYQDGGTYCTFNLDWETH